MSAFIDPLKVRYAPEVLPEAFNNATVATGGTTIAEYSRYEPYVISIDNMMVERGTSLETNVTADGLLAMRIHHEGTANLTSLRESSKIIAKRDLSLQMKATGGAPESNIGTYYNIEVRDPSIVDKIRLGMNLTADEETIATNQDLRAQLNAGLIPNHPDLLSNEIFKEFDEVITVPRRMPIIAAGGEEDIGSTINVPSGKVCVLLGIAVDAATIIGDQGVSDTYVMVDRDQDRSYIKMDAAIMPGGAGSVADYMMRMYVPAVDKFRAFIQSTSGEAANLKARFVYGVRKMTYIDHLKWNIPFKATELADANAAIQKYGLVEKVAAGVL